MDRIPKNLRVSIDGWNKVVDESKYKVPAFALQVNQFKIGDATIAVTSTYPYDLAEITRKKSAGKKGYNDKPKSVRLGGTARNQVLGFANEAG